MYCGVTNKNVINLSLLIYILYKCLDLDSISNQAEEKHKYGLIKNIVARCFGTVEMRYISILIKIQINKIKPYYLKRLHVLVNKVHA